MSLRFDIPIPPSSNGLYANSANGGRYTTPAYSKWQKWVAQEIDLQRRQWDEGQKAIAAVILRDKRYTMRLSLPQSMQGDCDNRLKAANDALKKMGLIVDDRYAERCEAEKDPSVAKGWAVLRLFPSPMREGA